MSHVGKFVRCMNECHLCVVCGSVMCVIGCYVCGSVSRVMTCHVCVGVTWLRVVPELGARAAALVSHGGTVAVKLAGCVIVDLGADGVIVVTERTPW